MPATPPRPPAVRRPSRPGGFTLIELLVTIGIIVLLIAIALPAFNFLTGSKSTQAAGNLLDSALGIARNNALGLQQTQGLAVFHSARDDREVAALVELRTFPFANYATGTPSVPIAYAYGQYVTVTSEMYVCIEAYQDTAASNSPTTNTTLWKDMGPTSLLTATGDTVLEFVPTGERQLMPTGLDCRGVGNMATVTAATVPPVASTSKFRYFSPAVVLFDGFGQLSVTQYKVLADGLLGSEIKRSATDLKTNYLVPPLPQTTTNQKPYFSNVQDTNQSQIGFVLYDGAVFRGQNATPLSTAGTDAAATSTIDKWLDDNATPLLVNRYNGTLVKGE